MKIRKVSLYDRLPEVYRERDEQQEPKYQLREYLGIYESLFSVIYDDIENLYHNLFIETCDPWVIPYIGDLLGVSHLRGDIPFQRADVANTIALRRRKGTIGALERLTYDLTGWGVHCSELRERLVLNQNVTLFRDQCERMKTEISDRLGDVSNVEKFCSGPTKNGTLDIL